MPTLGRPVRVLSSTSSFPTVSRFIDISDPTILVALPKAELVASTSENALNNLLEKVVVEQWNGPSVTVIVDSLRSLQDEITGLHDEVRKLTASDTAKTAEIATLNGNIATLNGDIASLTANIDTISRILNLDL